MPIKRISALLLLTLVAFISYAQDPQFSQYYQAPLYLNPGFTGITPGHRVVVNHRVQWPGLPQAYATYAASYDVFLENIRSGIGVMIMSDRMGSVNWNSTTANVLYSYKISLTDELVFSPGLSFGYGTNGLDHSRLRMGDALEYQGQSIDPKINDLRGQQFFDFSSGFVLYAKRMWLGASFMHLNRPSLSVVGSESPLSVKTSIHGGMRLDIRNRFRRGNPVYFTPSFVYRRQGNFFSQLDLGANFHVDPVSVGVWYRGIPVVKGVGGIAEQDALILFMGLYLKNLSVGYSYDFTVSPLHNASGGSHEVSLTYEFRTKRQKPRRQRLIPCPAFYNDRRAGD